MRRETFTNVIDGTEFANCCCNLAILPVRVRSGELNRLYNEIFFHLAPHIQHELRIGLCPSVVLSTGNISLSIPFVFVREAHSELMYSQWIPYK